MTKLEAISKYWKAFDRLRENTSYDGNGKITIQPSGFKGAETKAAKRAIALCRDDREFIELCAQVRKMTRGTE